MPACSPYATSQFPKYAEPIPDKAEELKEDVHVTTAALQAAAKAHGVYLIGGESAGKREARKGLPPSQQHSHTIHILLLSTLAPSSPLLSLPFLPCRLHP